MERMWSSDMRELSHEDRIPMDSHRRSGYVLMVRLGEVLMVRLGEVLMVRLGGVLMVRLGGVPASPSTG